MTNFVLTFRNAAGHVTDEVEGPAWMAWFGELGSSIVDMGSQVGGTSSLGDAPRTGGVVTGYTIVQAADLDAAVLLAKGCPGLAHGGAVEVGELIGM
jgi:hypothetical protein